MSPRLPPCLRLPLILALLVLFSPLARSTVAQPMPDRPAEPPEAERVVILANSAESHSEALARDYARARAIPSANIISLPLPSVETVTWRTFIDALWTPLQERLVRDGWIDAVPSTLRDDLGRRKWAVNGNRIAYLVLCRGVPLRIEHDEALYRENPPSTRNARFRVNNGAVDSELSLLAVPQYPINGLVPNPLFNHHGPPTFEQSLVVRVTRLDGPSDDDARSLFESAQEAERDGLIGRYLVDTGGPHPTGDAWLTAAADRLAELGFDGEVDRTPATVPPTARADQLAWYFAWYQEHIDGPFRVPGFRLAPGAIALHIHSFSATTLRSPVRGWTGPLAARGVAAAFGNVAEPYLELTHQPPILVAALARGLTLGDAAYRSINVLSWQGVVVGDPLYRPFALPLEAQWQRHRPQRSRKAATVGLRLLALADRASQAAPADWLLKELSGFPPNPSLLLALARRAEARGDTAGARGALLPLSSLPVPAASDWGVFAEGARMLGRLGAEAAATDAWRTLLAASLIPPTDQAEWLRTAAGAARAAGNLELAARWERELAAARRSGD